MYVSSFKHNFVNMRIEEIVRSPCLFFNFFLDSLCCHTSGDVLFVVDQSAISWYSIVLYYAYIRFCPSQNSDFN